MKYTIVKTASGKYTTRIRIGNDRVSVTRSTEAEVKKAVEELKARYLLTQKRQTYISDTLGGLIDKFIEDREGVLSPSTIEGYRNIRRNRFKPYMVKKIAKINWQKMISDEAESVSAKTVKNGWALVVGALKYANIQIPNVRLPQIVKNEHPYLTSSQVKQFISLVKDTDIELPALLGLHSLRRSEIYGLRWEDVDLEKRLLHVCNTAYFSSGNRVADVSYKAETKTSESNRYVPIMIPRLYELLTETRKKGPVVPADLVGPQMLNRGINRICEQNGLPKIGTHGLRHSFASVAYHFLPARLAMRIGGWKNVDTMNKIYTHIADSELVDLSTEMSTFFEDD